jgi:hypothetical protein
VNLMLFVMFVCVGAGLLLPRIGRREQWGIAGLATVMTALYFFVGRLM